jgi:E3 ubiquitin-protein ligase RNF115/126
MEQYANQNMPPPASSEAIDNLPKIKIQVETLGDNSACTICQDDFKQDEEAIKLPCNHLFHPNCIIEWLKVNGDFTLLTVRNLSRL